MKTALYLALLCASMASAAPGGKSGKSGPVFSAATSAPAAGAGSSGGGHAGGTTVGRALYMDPRHAPEMAPERKVEERDCTKPLDLAAGGNLKCK
jgi:hypothetical protein